MAELNDLVDSSGYSLFDNILHYGLLLGAAFQLVCILAVIFLPASESEVNQVYLVKFYFAYSI